MGITRQIAHDDVFTEFVVYKNISMVKECAFQTAHGLWHDARKARQHFQQVIMEVMTTNIDIRNSCLPIKTKTFPEAVPDMNISLQIKRNCLLALNNISMVTDHLYLSSATVLTPSTLKALDIAYVVNIAPELPDTPLPNTAIKYSRIPIYDNLSSNLMEYFEPIADAINEVVRLNQNVLVHCVAGVSRSATLCIAYLMKHMGLNLLQSYNHVKKQRPIIRPNCSFIKQLIDFENKLYGSNSVVMVYNEHLNMMIPDLYTKDYKSTHEFKKERNNSVKG